MVEPTLGAISRFILVRPKRQSMTDCYCAEKVSSVAASSGVDSTFRGGLALWWFRASEERTNTVEVHVTIIG